MSKDNVTAVVFRKWRRRSDEGILALFPEEAADPWGNCLSYEHIGQHGAADYALCIQNTVPATPEEYAPLAEELEELGYKLKILKRRGPSNRGRKDA